MTAGSIVAELGAKIGAKDPSVEPVPVPEDHPAEQHHTAEIAAPMVRDDRQLVGKPPRRDRAGAKQEARREREETKRAERQQRKDAKEAERRQREQAKESKTEDTRFAGSRGGDVTNDASETTDPATVMGTASLDSKSEVNEHERAELQERAREEEQEAKDQREYARREARREREEAKAAARRERKEAKEAKQEARRERKETKRAERQQRKDAKQTKLEARQLSRREGEGSEQKASSELLPGAEAVADNSNPEVDARTVVDDSEVSADDTVVPQDLEHDVTSVPDGADMDAVRRANEEWNAERERIDAERLLAVDSDPAPELGDAKEVASRERAEAKEVARRERAEAKEAARRERQQAEVEVADSRSARHAKDDDHIVEAPRGPKVSLTERRRQKSAAKRSSTTVEPERRKDPEAASSRTEGGSRALVITAGILGAVGLVCSVILAIGALLVAIGTTDGSTVFDVVSNISDALVGPLRGLFTFGGDNGDMKEALVAWGIGSMAYLAVGVAAQSVVRSRSED